MACYFGAYAPHLAIVGTLSLSYVALKVVRFTLRLVCRTIRRSFPVDLKQYGRWAVVTGCTEGIGKSYVLQLAEKGTDVVLISRNPQKLSSVAEQIVQQHQVAVKVITADFKETDIYENIKEQLRGLDIGILVNNVAMLNRRTPGYFCEAEDIEQFNKDIVSVNILSYFMMTAIVLPGMQERKRGAIINIASGSSLRPYPFFAVYCSTKVCVRFFSECLNREYSSQGITVQTVIPSSVQSKLSARISKVAGIGPGLFYPSADEFVSKALNTIGRESTTSVHWPHEFQQYMESFLSDPLFTALLLRERNKMVKFLKAE